MKADLFYLNIALQVADVLTTLYAIRSGKGTEGNGILAPFFKLVGLVPGLLIIKGAFVALLIWGAPMVAIEVLAVLAVFYGWVIFNNVRVITK